MAWDRKPTEGARFQGAELLKRLEEGVRELVSSDNWRSYLSAQAKFHQYSFGNVLLIMACNHHATRVAGFHTWLDLGRRVKKGEKGIPILAPVFPKKEKGADRRQDPEDASRRDPVFFRVAYVFDIAQTEGQPLPDLPCRDLGGDSPEARLLVERLLRVATDEGLHVEQGDPSRMHGAKGFYRPSEQLIVLAKGLAPDQQAKTLAHELAHHMLDHRPGSEDRPQKEAEAESAAFVVCQHYGIDTSDYSFGYIAEWSLNDGGLALVKQVAVAAQKVSSRIIDGIEKTPVLERAPEQEHMQEIGQDRGDR